MTLCNLQYLKFKLNKLAQMIKLTVIATDGDVSKISTSKFYPSMDIEETRGVYITLPTRRRLDVFMSGDLKIISSKLDPKIVNEVQEEIEDYFKLTEYVMHCVHLHKRKIHISSQSLK